MIYTYNGISKAEQKRLVEIQAAEMRPSTKIPKDADATLRRILTAKNEKEMELRKAELKDSVAVTAEMKKLYGYEFPSGSGVDVPDNAPEYLLRKLKAWVASGLFSVGKQAVKEPAKKTSTKKG